MTSAHDRANRPIYLGSAGGNHLHLYLAPRGEWDQEAKAVKAIKRYLRTKNFTVEPITRSSALYGVHNIPCLQFGFYDRLDEDHKLEIEEVTELRKLVRTQCSATGQAQATAVYYDGRHVNTEVIITVHEGAVTTPEAERPYVKYDILQRGNAYSFYLAQPVGKEAEDPARAATTVAETLGIYTSNRIVPDAIRRKDLITPPFDQPYGDPTSASFM